MRRINFKNGQYYHIYNRGVEKRDIFLDEGDYFRFIHNLYEFNNSNPVLNLGRDLGGLNEGGETSFNQRKPRKRLVDIICFCQMPNHFHIILKQLVEGGISKFMQKIGTGYTVYFNIKYERSGVLFQGVFKAVHIEAENYLTYLSRYIHLNPAELKESEWKKGGIKNWKLVNEFLENYRWSSYPDYIGKKNFPSVTNRELILKIFGDEKNYKRFIKEWLAKDLQNVKEIVLE